MKEKVYLTQIFGPKAYLKNAFPYVVSLFFILTGLGYGISSKTIKNEQNSLILGDSVVKIAWNIEKSSWYLKKKENVLYYLKKMV